MLNNSQPDNDRQKCELYYYYFFVPLLPFFFLFLADCAMFFLVECYIYISAICTDGMIAKHTHTLEIVSKFNPMCVELIENIRLSARTCTFILYLTLLLCQRIIVSAQLIASGFFFFFGYECMARTRHEMRTKKKNTRNTPIHMYLMDTHHIVLTCSQRIK